MRASFVLAAAAAVGIVVGAAPLVTCVLAPTYSDTVSGCRVTDGDTIRCGDERIRLLGIDAPELPGHCSARRHCAPGDPYASSSSLKTATTGELRIERVGEDHYGRTLAIVAGSRGDLSCWQLSHGQAIYKAAWDDGLRVARLCPSTTL
jgi:endonuclease YncB( thermonuclease family)